MEVAGRPHKERRDRRGGGRRSGHDSRLGRRQRCNGCEFSRRRRDQSAIVVDERVVVGVHVLRGVGLWRRRRESD